jgi:SAM-dependent methyltransferase
MFVEIPSGFLESIATGSDRIPKLYYHPCACARKFFWLRLRAFYKLIEKHARSHDACLDFGCGSGVLLPTLSGMFREVVGIDLEISEAGKVMEYCGLQEKNIRLIGGDINTADIPRDKFDVICAADVLEHFRDLESPIRRIKDWLKDTGILLTSLPTESIATRMTRVFGGYKKPLDHYRTGEEVEKELIGAGFKKAHTQTIYPIFPLYVISVWKK